MCTDGESRSESLHLENYMKDHTSCSFLRVSTVMGIGFDNQSINMCGIDYNRFPEMEEVMENDAVFDGIHVLDLYLSSDGFWILNRNFGFAGDKNSFEISTAIRQGQPAKADNLILEAIEKEMAKAVKPAA